jgi:hypothetical protein
MLAAKAKFVLLQGFFTKLIAKSRPLSALVCYRHVFAIHPRDRTFARTIANATQIRQCTFLPYEGEERAMNTQNMNFRFSLRVHARIPRRE